MSYNVVIISLDSEKYVFSGPTGVRDLYCVLECDRVHKARTVVSIFMQNVFFLFTGVQTMI